MLQNGSSDMAWGAIILVVIILSILYYSATRHYTFWTNAGVKCLNEPTLRGAIEGTFLSASAKEVYDFEPGEPYVGAIKLNAPALIVRDPDLVRLILSKDFIHFHERGMPYNEKRNPLSIHLFNIEGKRWKILRAKLTPTFTSGKLRGMFPLIKHCVDQMSSIVETHADKSEAVDLNDLLSRCTTDVILSCAFGLQGSSLNNPDDIYRKLVKNFFRFGKMRRFSFIVFSMFPSLENIVPLTKEQKAMNNFFINTFTTTVKEREQSGVQRKDFLDLLIEIRKNGYLTDGHNDEDALDTSLEFTYNIMAAQAFVFFTAGSETSSSTTSFAVVELANNPDIQEKLREEVDESIKRHGELTYEGVNEMAYLDQVVSETLRRYPSVTTLIRKVSKPYPMPDGRVTLPVGMRVSIPVGNIHHDPRYYTDPMRFDPERFSPEAKRNRHKYVYIPFGEGPRICIGMRFALAQVKLTLASLISQFELRPKPGVPYPPELSKKSAVTALAHGAQVLVTKRTTKH